jgi:hypothetical protein
VVENETEVLGYILQFIPGLPQEHVAFNKIFAALLEFFKLSKLLFSSDKDKVILAQSFCKVFLGCIYIPS